jgi:ABC-type proline/glycine betaine transport system permease subunit
VAAIVGGALIRALRRREQPIVLAIAGAVVVVLAILPIALVLVDVDLDGLSALANSRTWTLLGRTLALVLAVVLVALAIGVPLGVLSDARTFRCGACCGSSTPFRCSCRRSCPRSAGFTCSVARG